MLRGNVRALNNGQVHFGFNLDPQVDKHLQCAAARVSDPESTLQALNAARCSAPDQLEVLQALYKYQFYRGELQQALDNVYQVLIKASIQGGFSRDWTELTIDSTDWTQQRGPSRSFLYALKALAFIRLRQEDVREAERILRALYRIDPQDQVGAGVIRDLLDGLLDEHDE